MAKSLIETDECPNCGFKLFFCPNPGYMECLCPADKCSFKIERPRRIKKYHVNGCACSICLYDVKVQIDCDYGD